MQKLSKILVGLVGVSLILSVAIIATQTRVGTVSRLLLYRITIPSAQRALCAAKRKVQPDHKEASAVCESLGLSPILRANRQQLFPNETGPVISLLTDETDTAAEIVAKAHTRLHLLEKITFIASTLKDEQDLVGKDVMPSKIFGARPAQPSICINTTLNATGLTEERPDYRSSDQTGSSDQAQSLNGSVNDDDSVDSSFRFYLLQGFGLANVGVLEGPSGLVLIDTAESAGNLIQALRQLWRAAFRSCAKKYIVAALISHHHTDHIGGLKGIDQYNTQVAAERGEGPPPKAVVVAHASTIELYTATFLQHPQAKYRRGLKQFGASEFLTIEPPRPAPSPGPPGVISAGIGHTLGHIDGAGGVTYPTHEWSGLRESLWFDGLEIEMRLLPGETTDQVCFYFPRLKVLHVSDNFYFAFPNIYPLRGGVFRSPLDWVASLDVLLHSYTPSAMSTGHTNPVFGVENVKLLLQRYRDSIQFVHDQTIRLMNRLNDPDAIARGVADLFWTTFPKPKSLTIEDVLSDPAMPFYGQVHWAAKAVVFRERGWFGGNDVEINSHKLPQGRRYARMRDLAENTQPLSSAILDALSAGDCQWALELATMVLKADETEPEKADPAACPSIEEDDVWLSTREAQGIPKSTALELRQVYSDWRNRICQRMQTNHRTERHFNDPFRHGQITFSKGAANRKSANGGEATTSGTSGEATSVASPPSDEDDICPPLQAMNSLSMSTLKARPLFLCLRREALWCLARRELPSSGRNWYLVEALSEREKSLEEISHLRVAHRIRQDFLQRVPDLPAVIRNFPERFEPGIISFDNVGFWITLVESKHQSEDDDKRYPEQKGKLKEVRSPRQTTIELIARNQILTVRDIPDRENTPKPDVQEFVDIWMTLDAMRSVLLKQYPAGPIRLFMLGDIWFESGDWKTRLRHFCHYLEILLAIEHE